MSFTVFHLYGLQKRILWKWLHWWLPPGPNSHNVQVIRKKKKIGMSNLSKNLLHISEQLCSKYMPHWSNLQNKLFQMRVKKSIAIFYGTYVLVWPSYHFGFISIFKNSSSNDSVLKSARKCNFTTKQEWSLTIGQFPAIPLKCWTKKFQNDVTAELFTTIS